MSLALAWCAHAQWAHKTGGFPFSKSRKICYVNDTSSECNDIADARDCFYRNHAGPGPACGEAAGQQRPRPPLRVINEGTFPTECQTLPF